MSTSEPKNNIIILYDDLQLSSEEIKLKFEAMITAIEKVNENKSLNHNALTFLFKDRNMIKLKNKYYEALLTYEFWPVSKIKEIIMEKYNGIIVVLTKHSIPSKTFSSQIFPHLKSEYFSSVILFLENRDILFDLESYSDFVSQTLENHFEIICDCGSTEFNDDDGIGALSMSLHSGQWRKGEEEGGCGKTGGEWNSGKIKVGSLNVSGKDCNESAEKTMLGEGEDCGVFKKSAGSESSENKKRESECEKSNDIEKGKSSTVTDSTKDGEKITKLEEENFDVVFNKINEVKQQNLRPGISLEERRQNAENAMIMLMKAFGLKDEGEEEDNEE